MSGYGLESDDAEAARLRRQAAGVHLVDAELWPSAGVVPGADVVDLGCGPAAVMLELAPMVGPQGSLTGVDADPAMVARGRAAAEAAGADTVVVREGRAEDSGLPTGSFDVALVRLVLIHNGGRERAIVDHAASLLRPGGRVVLYDLDITMIRVQPPAAPVSELGERFLAYQEAVGNDPGVGLRLPELLEGAGLSVDDFRGTTRIGRRTAGTRGPTWAARRAMVDAGVATEDDLERWEREFAALDAQDTQPWMVGCVFVAVGRLPV
ncbi:methyltransferase domain-containing protein [Actinomycetospora sp.]|uniref:methyltransferase domain-containing protein n=1 Tax=Actinomycetospora sp. TaxID=1872135 RepID=UPI002F3FCF2D